MAGPRILLIVGGGIAAYKACELVRTIRRGGGSVTCVLTDGGAKFVTPMALAALSENPVHTTLWDLRNEVEMGHIQLSRQADLVVVCPATANLMAKMAHGIADDLATTLLLATDKPVVAIPAMNVRMWQHEATQRNIATLRDAGVFVMDPDSGAMACGEYGPGRLPEPEAIWAQLASWFTGPDALPMQDGAGWIAPATPDPAPLPDQAATGFDDPADAGLGGLNAGLIRRDVQSAMPARAGGGLLAGKGAARGAPATDPGVLGAADPLAGQPDFAPDHPVAVVDGALAGRHVLVTAGPTHEPIDPVRYIANRSSGRQGFAIAAAAARRGARVTLVAGPVHLATPPGVDRIDVESAREMNDAVRAALPADVAVMVAAVADWRPKDFIDSKIKKRGSAPPVLVLTENPDILAGIGADSALRPGLLIGFAAETNDVLRYATDKRRRKGADWIIANDVSFGAEGGSVMGGADNTVHIVTADGVEHLPTLPKDQVADAIVDRIAHALS